MYEQVEAMGQAVARMIDIDGSRVMIKRRYPNGGLINIQAVVGMLLHTNDHIKTDLHTVCCIEFLIGGRGLVGKNVECMVGGHREMYAVGNQTAATARRVWNKIDKQKAQLQIQTNGGVIGIEG